MNFVDKNAARNTHLPLGCVPVGVGAIACGGACSWLVMTGWIAGVPLVIAGAVILHACFKVKKVKQAPALFNDNEEDKAVSVQIVAIALACAGVGVLLSLRVRWGWIPGVPMTIYMVLLALSIPLAGRSMAPVKPTFLSRFRWSKPKPVRAVPRPAAPNAPFVIAVTAVMQGRFLMVGGTLMHGRVPNDGARFVIKRTGKTGTVLTTVQGTGSAGGNRVVLLGDSAALQSQVSFATTDIVKDDVQVGDMVVGL